MGKALWSKKMHIVDPLITALTFIAQPTNPCNSPVTGHYVWGKPPVYMRKARPTWYRWPQQLPDDSPPPDASPDGTRRPPTCFGFAASKGYWAKLRWGWSIEHLGGKFTRFGRVTSRCKIRTKRETETWCNNPNRTTVPKFKKPRIFRYLGLSSPT